MNFDYAGASQPTYKLSERFEDSAFRREVFMSKQRQASRAKRELPPWTIAVFMVGGPELESSIDRDVLELERAGSSDSVNVIAAVQRSGRAHTTYLQVMPRGDEGQPQKSKKIGRSTVGDLNTRLNKFLAFVARRYKSQHYSLIFWGHASGLGFGRLGSGSQEDLIRLKAFVESLRKFRESRADAQKLEILGFCACALSKAEFAIELREEVDFLVSSQVGISTLMTWPFDRIVQRVVMSPQVAPGTFASQIVQCFEESYEPPPIALTALHLQKSEEVGRQVDAIAKSILKAIDQPKVPGRVNNLSVLSAFQRAISAYPYELEPLIDFFDFCRKLVEEEALEELVRAEAREVLDKGARAFVVCNARSGPKLGALNGLSILAPDLKDPNWVATWTASHAWLWTNTQWAEVTRRVHRFAFDNPEFLTG
jgi:hypothetical protein